jgi:hypothetical protein
LLLLLKPSSFEEVAVAVAVAVLVLLLGIEWSLKKAGLAIGEAIAPARSWEKER